MQCDNMRQTKSVVISVLKATKLQCDRYRGRLSTTRNALLKPFCTDIDQLAKPTLRSRYAHTPFGRYESE